MLVYVNRFIFEPVQGTDQIIQLIAKWVSQRARSYVDPGRLALGIRELKLKDGSSVSSRATLVEDKTKVYPFWFCAQLSHRDDRVSGRRWITEVGVRQESEERPIECSVLLKTDEVSARVTSPIQVTRPKLVQQLIESCKPLGQTPGLRVKELTLASASAFLREVEHEERDFPIVVVSALRDGGYPVEPERVRSIVTGLADVVCVTAREDTFAIEEIVGRRYMAFGGAINIVFPTRRGERGHFVETVLFRAEDVDQVREDGKSIESEVLAAITHRTNLPLSWRHISAEKVAQAVLRARLAETIARAKSGEQTQHLEEYIALLESADEELKAKDEELAQSQSAYEAKEQEVRVLRADIANLKHALAGLQSSDEARSDIAEMLGPFRDTVAAILKVGPTLQQVVDLMATMYSDRIVFLESASNSAKEADRGGFRQAAKALDLLHRLATDYWQVLSDGKGDQQAKAVFGQSAYAANEADTLSGDGRRRRTFSYRGRDFLMYKHLKHGVKDSLAETLRVHFEWLANEKKIIVGHCGKHLDF